MGKGKKLDTSSEQQMQAHMQPQNVWKNFKFKKPLSEAQLTTAITVNYKTSIRQRVDRIILDEWYAPPPPQLRPQPRISSNMFDNITINTTGTTFPQGGTQPMAGTKFKPGDHVKFINPGTLLTDFVGVVVKYDNGQYAVDFKDEPKLASLTSNVLHNCDGNITSLTGYWCNVSNLELVIVKSKAPVNFDSVIISDDKRQQILEALEQVNKEKLIFEDWGFAETIEKGRGVGMLFYGEPGTGKTLMGQAIAHKLGRTLRIIGTADIESSKPGEAERNIRKYFEEAKRDKAILLFDECDSLIFSRAGVGAILGAQINELLSQIERFEGVTIFTTNRLGTLDEAVNRRLALKLAFDMPTKEERVMIWQRMIPKKAPMADDVDYEALSVVEITGGYIKNAVLRAARMAAIMDMPDKEKQIKQEHMVKALRLEAEAMIEFNKARNEHQRGVGVARYAAGGRQIVTGNDMDKVRS